MRASSPFWRRRRQVRFRRRLECWRSSRRNLSFTNITDAGCAALAAALDSGALPALKNINLDGTLASAAAQAAVQEALKRSIAAEHLRVLSLVDDAVAMIWCGGSGAC